MRYVWLAIMCVGLGCGGGSDTTSSLLNTEGSGGAGNRSWVDGDIPSDAGMQADAGSKGDGGSQVVNPVADRKRGLVQLSQMIMNFPGGSSISSTLWAQFVRNDVLGSGVCTPKQIGTCLVLTGCQSNSASDAGIEYTHAGPVTITGGKVPLALEPGANALYRPLTKDERVFDEGTLLTFIAQGNSEGVPAFQAQVKSPILVTMSRLNGQTWPTNQIVAIPRSLPLKIEWSGNGDGFVNIGLGVSTIASANCRFDASSKTGTIPTEVLNAMPAAEGVISVSQLMETKITVGAHDVTNTVLTYPKTSSGQLPSLSVLFTH